MSDHTTTQEMIRISRSDAASWDVLIVDDERDNLDVISRLLSFLGASVQTAESGHEALQILKSSTPTFILADLMMPEMNGWKLFDAIRANTAYNDIPVIAVTASTMNIDRTLTDKHGFDGFIPKPFSISIFLLEINRCLNKTAAAH